jgi:hypothetical protein
MTKFNQKLLFLVLFIFSCKKEIPKEDTTTKAISTINYAKGFDIIEKMELKN